MRNEDSEFSSLKTVSSFDQGEPCTVAIDLTAQEDIQSFSPSSLLVESLIEQLCSLMEKDPRDQKKLYLTVCQKLHQMNLIGETYERDEFQFMRSHYQKALYQLLAIAKKTTVDNRVIMPKPLGDIPPANNVLDCSRYCSEFQELDYIAHGGFGHVYKVQHKLDNGLYAVKKIFLRYQSVNDFLQNLREVKMLAKLNHPNIVAYKAAWLEPLVPKKKTLAVSDNSESQNNNDDSLEVIFEGSGGDNSVGKEVEKSVETITSSNSFSVATDGMICEYNKNRVYKFGSYKEKQTTQSAILFIQMQLCQKTLRQWLDTRNETNQAVDLQKCSDIFKQVVKGIEYIHSQGIVHHDIKPSNIFISDDLREVQVGDFGLACCLLTHQPSSLSVVTTHQPGQVGTKLYAAPEQLKGTCHPKSDIYSLGIVLFELIQPFCTAMERSKMIAQLKSGHIPTELAAKYPFFAKIISQTVNGLNKRPTATELVNRLDESQNSDTLNLIAAQKETIQLLRKESLEKDQEIALLKEQLEKLLNSN